MTDRLSTELLVNVESDEMRWKGWASIRPLLVPIDSVESHPRNPRRGNLDVVSTSLETFGQTKPIIVQSSSRYIVAGNHTRLAAMERLDWTHIAVVLAAMSDDEALEYLMMDNRSSDVGDYDESSRVAILEELQERGRLNVAGYTPDDLDDILAAQQKIAETAAAEFAGGYSETEDEVAERQAVRLAGEAMREIVLMVSESDYASFAAHVKILQREWSLSGTTATVVEAIKRAAESA